MLGIKNSYCKLYEEELAKMRIERPEYDDEDDEVFIGRDLAHAKAHSEVISGEIDKEVKSIIDDCYQKAKDIIIQNERVLHACAELLLEKEKITREEFEALFVQN